MKMLKSFFFTLFIFLSQGLSAQPSMDSLKIAQSMYKVNPWLSGGISVAGYFSNSIGWNRLRKAPALSEERLLRLNDHDLMGLDRIALRQNPSFEKTEKAGNFSDALLLSSAVSPVLLFLDSRIRREWFDVTLIYLESQIATSNFYSWGPLGPSFIERLRPAAYYTELSIEDRSAGNNKNSFFSGHVASTATAWFFMAKVYGDFHPELGAKKLLFYGLAAIPTTVVAINRVKALRHFPTDTIVGGLVGGAIGILIPSIHKRTKGRLSLVPIYNDEQKRLANRCKL